MSLIKTICNDKISAFLFLFIYFILIIESIGVYYAKDDDVTSYLIYWKLLYVINAIMTVWSHIKTARTEPGKITHELNPHFVEFYLNLRDTAMQRANKFNQTYGKMLFDKMDDDDKISDEYTDYDSYEYPQVTSILDEVAEKVSKEHSIELKRCDRCCIIRLPGVRHCSRCQGCIFKMDHHCPWVFNCIGQFNQKFFIQFIGYSLGGIFFSTLIGLYYVYYKDRN